MGQSGLEPVTFGFKVPSGASFPFGRSSRLPGLVTGITPVIGGGSLVWVWTLCVAEFVAHFEWCDGCPKPVSAIRR